mgnify:CR=1 FL=1
MPKALTSRLAGAAGSNSSLHVGMLNGLMPCGPLQAMQLYALSTGNALKGAFSVMLFTLGTVPYSCWMGMIRSTITVR